MNLACSSCHLLNSGNFSEMSNYLQQLDNLIIIQFSGKQSNIIHSNALSIMYKSVGAEPYKLNSKELNQLEFFHSFVSSGIL